MGGRELPVSPISLINLLWLSYPKSNFFIHYWKNTIKKKESHHREPFCNFMHHNWISFIDCCSHYVASPFGGNVLWHYSNNWNTNSFHSGIWKKKNTVLKQPLLLMDFNIFKNSYKWKSNKKFKIHQSYIYHKSSKAIFQNWAYSNTLTMTTFKHSTKKKMHTISPFQSGCPRCILFCIWRLQIQQADFRGHPRERCKGQPHVVILRLCVWRLSNTPSPCHVRNRFHQTQDLHLREE